VKFLVAESDVIVAVQNTGADKNLQEINENGFHFF